MKRFLLIGISLPLLCAEYLTNKSCQECHPDIYDEYRMSWHARGYFNDTLHREVSKKIPRYDCGACHMPAATNQEALTDGSVRPNPIHQTQRDAVACFYCHQIAYVKAAHAHNEITLARQAEGYKPTLYGSLENPDDSDKHAMVHSPIYSRYACTGCHGHKRNAQGVLVFRTANQAGDSQPCIRCHMPYTDGAPEKMNKRARAHHRSHRFAGIHDTSMREKSVAITFENPSDNRLCVTLKNTMGHALIIHPARMKYLALSLIRDNATVWKNFTHTPDEDPEACFEVSFEDSEGKPAAIPYFAAKRGRENNLEANASKTLCYKVPSLHKDDRIVAQLYVVPAKADCAAAAGLGGTGWTEPLLMKETAWTVPKEKP